MRLLCIALTFLLTIPSFGSRDVPLVIPQGIAPLMAPHCFRIPEAKAGDIHGPTIDIINLFLPTGKKVRPLLHYLSCALMGKDPAQSKLIAQALEGIHTASLLVDDVIDESEERRGAMTLWKLTNRNLAILAGQFLVAYNFDLAIDASQRLGSPVFAKAIPAVIKSMAAGEVLQHDLKQSGTYTEADWNQVADLKTGVLFGLALASAAEDREPKIIGRLNEIGILMGRLFQAQDDLNDVEKDRKEKNLNLVLVLASRMNGSSPLEDRFELADLKMARNQVIRKLETESANIIGRMRELFAETAGFSTAGTGAFQTECENALVAIGLSLGVPRVRD